MEFGTLLGNPSAKKAEAKAENKKGRGRRTVALQVLSERYLYRRAFSEVALLESVDYAKVEDGQVWLFATGGDIDSLTYLKFALNVCPMDEVVISTWVMSAEDIQQLIEWRSAGRFGRIDMYLGEIFPNKYKVEMAMIRDFYAANPDAGRYCYFRNHSKVLMAKSEGRNIWFTALASSNINTNKRTESCCCFLNREVYEFYKSFFDGINSFGD